MFNMNILSTSERVAVIRCLVDGNSMRATSRITGVARNTIGKRDPVTADVFVSDLASRLADRIQLTSDGLRTYFNAIVRAFGEGVDYARLVKVYGIDPEGEKRYSPAICTACKKEAVIGDPDP